MRITVYDILEYLASGMSEQEIIDDFPDLTRENMQWNHELVSLRLALPNSAIRHLFRAWEDMAGSLVAGELGR
jgi:hypothetical protein